jgi:hypothetical protein
VRYWLGSSKDHGAGNEPREQRREMHLSFKEARTKVEMKRLKKEETGKSE